MRILDLGAHDGYVTAWLRERYKGDLEVDGLELMPDAAAKARERGVNCKVGRAEDAPLHFEPGTYDRVLLLEVLEHVPDVDRLLSAAEAMLAPAVFFEGVEHVPGGLVVLSTPDGTFGEGSNPHHLRSYRAIDLADLLRRRGTLADMEVGRDGITAAAYSPRERRGDVGIYCGPGIAAWSPTDIATRGLGGSETAAVRLADALSDLGYVVTVYGECEATVFRDVLFRPHTAFDALEPRDVLISSRYPELGDRPIAAATTLLWAHDTDFGDRLTPERAERFDRVLALSEWHRRHLHDLYPFLGDAAWEPDGKLTAIRNGIHLPFFASEGENPERKPRVLYTSSPDRGLDVLLELWPQVRERVPDAELLYTYAPVYFEVAERDPTIAAHAARVRELSEQEGVRSLGSLPQKELARLMHSSLVWCAPSWNTPFEVPFHETSCIGAMEAMAAGCHVVASEWGALPETVKVGKLIRPAFVVPTDPGDRWREDFVEAIVAGLTEPQTQRFAQTYGPEVAARLGWEGVAEAIDALVEA